MKLHDAVVLLTGASRGLGAHAARRLAHEGARLALVARSAPALEGLANELGGLPRARPYPADVTDHDALARVVASAEADFGRIDVLVNNAGVEYYGHHDRSDPADLREQCEVNLTAPMVLARLVLPGMLARGQGHIVNVASTAGLGGAPWAVPYGATKAGLIGFSFGLRSELRDRGVGVSVVAPGFVEGAGMYERQKEDSGIESPALVGRTTLDEVSAAIARAIRENPAEIIVNSVPLRPMLGLGRTFPDLGGRMLRMLVGGYMHAMAELRARRAH